jgi:hypothetical protein
VDEYGELTGWTSDWADPETLPKAVSLEILFEEDVVLEWPMLTASVRIDAAALQDLAGSQGLRGTSVQELIKQRRNKD